MAFTNLISCANAQMIFNLKPTVNAAVNKLDIFTKSGGAVSNSANVISVAIPDGNGYTFRSRSASYLSGTSQFILADAANYWSKGSLDAEIKTAYIYAIWDGTGIIWALGGYSGFTRCPASTTVTDDDFFLLEESSTYTKAVTEYCVCVGKIRYQYDTADTPDHTIQATVIDAPMVVWNPRSDYAVRQNLGSTYTQVNANILDTSFLGIIVKQSGKYRINFQCEGSTSAVNGSVYGYIKCGVPADYSSATTLSTAFTSIILASAGDAAISMSTLVSINAGQCVYGGVQILRDSASGNSIIRGDSQFPGITSLMVERID